ncbi:MAG: thioredoxin family protein [Flavobacteriaceae bacterium]
MKNFVLTLLFLATISVAGAQEVKWLSFEEAIALNKKNPKPILLDMYTDWCGWCKKMDKTTYKNKVIVDYINQNFYAIKMDGEGKKDITFRNHTFKFKNEGRRGYHELAAALMNGKMSYPTTIFMNQKEELLDKIPGYLDAKTMEKVLAYFADEKYKTEKWADFDKNFKSQLK